MARVRTSPLKTSRNPTSKARHPAGFTMIEIMIVLVIMAFATGTAISRFSNNSRGYKVFIRQFRVITKQLHNRSKLLNTTHRLVLDLGDEGARTPEQKLWVESATKTGIILSDEDAEDVLKKVAGKESDSKKPPPFQKNPKALGRREVELPEGLIFKDVELGGVERPIESGLVYIYFLPQGLVTETAIHLKLEDQEVEKEWTISIHPLTGQAEIVGKYISLETLKDQ